MRPYDFTDLTGLKKLLFQQPGGFIADAYYREEAAQLAATVTGMNGQQYTGILPKTDEALAFVAEKNWRKFGV
ncbi:MAG: hypothetical protein ACYCT0_07160 [Sulfobacillus sp.]|jgi:hypothetical protein